MTGYKKFVFCARDQIKLCDVEAHVYNASENYVTLVIDKRKATAPFLEAMEQEYDAVYIGLSHDYPLCSHMTFRRKQDAI